jgi:hypothetical protein
MAGAWRTNAHATALPAFLDSSQLVAAVFHLDERRLSEGDTLKTIAGRFDVEVVRDESSFAQVVMLTDAPGLDARFGMTAAESSASGCSVVLFTSVHPRSWVGRAYYRVIEPLHHVLVELVLIRRLKRRAATLARSNKV